jgi:UDP-glucuronate 4-epimerase
MTVLVTGAAGFIGFHVCKALLARGDVVIGIDNLSAYYDVDLKRARLAELADDVEFTFHLANIADRAAVSSVIERQPGIDRVIHLAAQAGVRYSLENPYSYIESNIMGQVVLLEAVRRLPGLKSFVYASSSSVYGGNTKQPSSVDDRVDAPVSLYAATKRADELITHAYGHLYKIPATGLRYFTVYGPWGRPDMAAYLFADAIMAGRPLRVFNHGQMARDFTYIDDIVTGTLAALDRPPSTSDGVPWRVYNLGNHRPERLLDFIAALEAALGRKANLQLLPMEPGDVATSFADIEASRRDLGYEPKTPITVGLPLFVAWYKSYHGIA